MARTLNKLALLTAVAVTAVSCQKSAEDAPSVTVNKKLYVTSGTCYSGTGITTYAGPQTGQQISTYDSVTGEFQGSIFEMSDLTPFDANTTPVAMLHTTNSLLVMTENATSQGDRRVISLPKDNPSNYTPYATDQDAFTNTATHVLRGMALEADGSLLFSKSLFTEKISPANVRVVKGGANPWVNPAAITGTCFPAIPTYINAVGVMPPFTAGDDGKILMLHTGATVALNRILAVQRTGLTSATAADCAGVTAGGLSTVVHTNGTGLSGTVTFNAAGANPTAMVYIPTPAPATTTGVLLVTYSTPIATLFDNITNFNTGIVMWNVNETSDTAVTFTNPVIIYRNTSIVWAPSAITYDAETSSVYVAVGGSPGVVNQTTANNPYNIEKFTLNSDFTAPVLTRVHNDYKPFFIGNSATRCISGLSVE